MRWSLRLLTEYLGGWWISLAVEAKELMVSVDVLLAHGVTFLTVLHRKILLVFDGPKICGSKSRIAAEP